MRLQQHMRHARARVGITAGLLHAALQSKSIAAALCDVTQCPPGGEVGHGAYAPGETLDPVCEAPCD